jgi:hypothetical protein
MDYPSRAANDAENNASPLPSWVRFLGLVQIPLILLALVTLSYVGWRVRSLRTQLSSLNAQIESGSESLKATNDSLKEKQAQLVAVQTALTQSTAELKVKQLAVTVVSKSRSATIEYFPKDADGNRVEKALRELGFEFKPGNPRLPNVPTNTIFYGSEVSPQDVELVASALLQGGITLKLICRLNNRKTLQKALIEVGSTSNIDALPLLTKDAIRSGRAIPTGNDGELINGHTCSPR